MVGLTACSDDAPAMDLGGGTDLGELSDALVGNDSGPALASACSFGEPDCAAEAYCHFFASCGVNGRIGLCEPRPPACDDACPEVCGCDGDTYCSECAAARAGVSVVREGPCDEPDFGECTSADDCVGDQWCDFGGCPVDDSWGVCRPLHAAADCPLTGSTVCGCDGESYLNACRARAAGTNADFPGTCTL